jgi:epoxyqueuosine reductase
MPSPKEKVKAALLSAGFDRVGFTSANPLHEAGERYRTWIAAKRAGGMDYLYRDMNLRAEPGRFLPGARSVVAAAAAYAPLGGRKGPLGAYAMHRDYHTVFGEALGKGVDTIKSLHPDARCRTAVDASPLLERALAARAGLGWIGQSTNLIHRDFGPFLLLGFIVTTLPLEPDKPVEDGHCRDCGKCLEACPTGALSAPFTLDARRCISYLTIEKKGPFEDWEAEAIGGWAFGCDLCTTACAQAQQGGGRSSAGLLRPVETLREIELEGLLDLCEGGFKKAFAETPILRCGKSRLIRNLLTAGGNLSLPWVEERAEAHLRGGTSASRSAARRITKRGG